MANEDGGPKQGSWFRCSIAGKISTHMANNTRQPKILILFKIFGVRAWVPEAVLVGTGVVMA